MPDGQDHPKNTSGLRPPWKPGQSGNPGGRPKGSGLTDIIRRVLSQPDESYGTKADRLITLCLEHAEKGDFRYFKEVIDRLEGPIPTKAEVTGADGAPLFYKCVKGDWPEKV